MVFGSIVPVLQVVTIILFALIVVVIVADKK